MIMKHFSQMHFKAAALFLCASIRHIPVCGQFHENKAAIYFDYYTLALQWAPSVCEYYREHKLGDVCVVNHTISSWVTHGLWPTYKNGSKPIYCKIDWEFDYLELQEKLEYKMLQYFPFLLSSDKNTSYWEDQFYKYGSCGFGLRKVTGEFDYFRTALWLNRKYDVHGMLKKYDIVPRVSGYWFPSVVEAIRRSVGRKVLFGCGRDREGTTQYLGQIEICVKKDFSDIIDCDVPRVDVNISGYRNYFKDCTAAIDATYHPTNPSEYFRNKAIASGLLFLKNIHHMILLIAVEILI